MLSLEKEAKIFFFTFCSHCFAVKTELLESDKKVDESENDAC